jgi:hypothetical protein
MLSSIWMQCGGASEIRGLQLTAWRSVEAQHQISTRKLVDSDDEQRVLEDLIESSKPPQPGSRRLHYLLATAFRYPPLRYGSRFATRHELSLWYGAESLRTMFAEVAFYRFVFLSGTRANLGTIHTALSMFSIGVRTARGVDLTVPPFASFEAVLASRTSYAETQSLGSAMRAAGVEVVRYRSARDSEGGVNVGVFSERAFATTRPRRLESWHCTTTAAVVELVRRDYFGRATFSFGRDEFLVDGVLPSPA